MSGRSPGPPAAALLALLLAAGGGLLASDAASAQEGEGAGEGDEPILVEAPRPFRLSASASALVWEEAATRSPEDGSLWGLELGRHVLRWAYVRLSGAFGTSTVESGGRSADVDSYVVDVAAGPRFAFEELRRVGLVPYASVGVGAVVHDPRPDGLATRSQNAFLWGGGVEWSLRPDLGVRAEWRRYAADLEDVFAELDRTGEVRDADRLQLSVFWAF